MAAPIGDSMLVARLRRGAGCSGSISLEVNGQPAGTVEILLVMMMISGPAAQQARAAAEMSRQ